MIPDMRVDLHLHTTASDGRWTPQQLVTEVQRAGIGLFGVTDHDSMGSLKATARLVASTGLRFLPGIELSSRLDGTLFHILGYGFDPGDRELRRLVEANMARLNWENDEAVRLLARTGYPVSLSDYKTYSWDRTRGGWKALNYLLDLGLVDGVRGYFGGLFSGDGLVHPRAPFPPPDEVMATIRKAGGTTVLAHPGVGFYGQLDNGRLDALVEMGLQGLECYSMQHTVADTRRFLAYARSRSLLITGGSDCHGGFVGRELGVPQVRVRDLVLGELEERVIG
jgi:predicted metal-dependent phosphoesterase TrpH